MERTHFTLQYPPDSGFDKTDITFLPGEPDLNAVLLQDGQRVPRLFVTDTTIAALPAAQPFTAAFRRIGDASLAAPAYAAERGTDVLLVLGPGEPYKTMQTVLDIVRTALARNFTRQSEFVAIGGGVICDMTAFAASIFKRGITVRFVPTTLLAMVDAAIGGKSGCDFDGYKNMVGSFWPAATLSVWAQFVRSLPEHEYLSGLGEVLKTALLFSEELCGLLSAQREAVLAREPAVLERIISTCVQAKAAVVQEDFRERGKRAYLNLGHTFGHALEAVAGLGTVKHGAAVCWGIGRAAALSERLGLCTPRYAEEVQELLSGYGYDQSPIPQALPSPDAGRELVAAMHKDKKNSEPDTIRVILQRGCCDTLIRSVPDTDLEAVLR